MSSAAETTGQGRAAGLTAALGLAALVAVALRLGAALPPDGWLAAALHPAAGDVSALVFHEAVLPRLVVAFVCGVALSLAGTLFQQVLRNPLASPTTLGIEAGAQLTLAVVVIWLPGLLAVPLGREFAALVGAGTVTGLVFLVAWARGFSSLSLILAGLVVGLFCGALGAVLKLLNQEYVAVLYLWGAGSLEQQDWSTVVALLPRLAVLGLLVALVARPLAVLALDDMSARGLGLGLRGTRFACLALAVLLTVVVTASVGVIGFVGLAAPQVARLAGARSLGRRLVLAPLIGGFILVLVDQAAWAISGETIPVPAGAATALLGGPLLLWLLPRLRRDAPPSLAEPHATVRRAEAVPLLAVLAGALALAVLLALLVGRAPEGWTVAGEGTFMQIIPWRLPRVIAALAAGGMLAVAGTLLQRLTGNPMASPEVLGVGAGVALGLVAALLLVPAPSRAFEGIAGGVGAGLVLALLLSGGVRARFAPDQLLLTGIALGALLDAVVIGFLALGDPRASQVLAWIAGSTYGIEGGAAGATLAAAVPLIATALLLAAWLDLLPLGPATARSLGIPLGPTRAAVTLAAAALTASAMLVVGPLTFVGLMGPHLARTLGLVRAVPQILGATLIGATGMVLADWAGRTVIAPREVPAGLVAALIGAPLLVWYLARRGR